MSGTATSNPPVVDFRGIEPIQFRVEMNISNSKSSVPASERLKASVSHYTFRHLGDPGNDGPHDDAAKPTPISPRKRPFDAHFRQARSSLMPRRCQTASALTVMYGQKISASAFRTSRFEMNGHGK